MTVRTVHTLREEEIYAHELEVGDGIFVEDGTAEWYATVMSITDYDDGTLLVTFIDCDERYDKRERLRVQREGSDVMDDLAKI